MKTILGRPTRAIWQNELIDRLTRSNALVVPALEVAPFTQRFQVLFTRWQGHWRVDVWPREPDVSPSVVIIETLKAVLDRVQASGWTRSERDCGVDSVWIDGRFGSRQVTVHVRLAASG